LLTILPTSKKLDVIRHNLDLAPILAFLLPPVLTKLAFDRDLLPLDEVLIYRLAGLPPQNNVEKVSLFDPLIAGLLATIDGYGELANGLTARSVFQLRVTSETAYDSYMVYVSHSRAS
jgi:hypothetical protein